MTYAGIKEIADRFGVTPQAAYAWTMTGDFPQPLAEMANGRIWKLEAVESWVRSHRPSYV